VTRNESRDCRSRSRLGFTMLMITTLILACALSCGPQLPSKEAEAYLSDTAWQTGLVYSVFDPCYGRLLPEVRRDTNFEGQSLTIDGVEYFKGFGGRLYSIIVYSVPPEAASIEGTVGIDDATMEGAVSGTYFSIWGDGKRLWQSPALSSDDPAVRFTVPVSGIQEIKLISDGQGYDSGDLADWCNVRWRTSQCASPDWHYVPRSPSIYVRADFHPFHLVYRGESIPVTVMAGQAEAVEVDCTILDESNIPVRETTLEPELAGDSTRGFVATALIPLQDIPNGLYQLKLLVTASGNRLAEKTYRFGLIESHLDNSIEGSIYGVNHHEFVASYEALAAAGVEWSRLWFCWAWIEPAKGDWQWSWYDERVAAAEEFGIKTIGVLGGLGQPEWSSPGNAPPGYETTQGCPANMTEWEDYVREVATRYRGQVTVWESWNEVVYPVSQMLYGWSVEKYVDLQRRTWRVLKEVDPANILLVDAVYLDFLESCLEAGLGDAYDGIVIHPYREGYTPEAICPNAWTGNTGDLLSVFLTAREWLNAHGRPDAQVWATEIGWGILGSGWDRPMVSEEDHGRYLARTFLLAQGSSEAANVCWHDFAGYMFGMCDGGANPRPAILSFASLVARLYEAEPVERYALEGSLQAFLFRRADKDVLALWSEQDTEFVMITPGSDLQLSMYDWFGNERTVLIPREGRAFPVTGRPVYLEGAELDQLQLVRVAPVQLSPESPTIIAGRETSITCTVDNLFAAGDRFIMRVDPPTGLSAGEREQVLSIVPGESGAFVIELQADRNASEGTRAVPITLILPDGLQAPLVAYVRIVSPMSVSVDPFDCTRLQEEAVNSTVSVRNQDQIPLSGQVTLAAPDGFTVDPAEASFSELGPGAETLVPFSLSAERRPTSGDALRLVVTTSDGARAEVARSLSPTVLDGDGDGLADGWGLFTHGNDAQATIEPGHAEFFCQRIDCTRFEKDWVILHRDGQDTIVEGKKYRITFWARQQGLESSLEMHVTNIDPWENCGIWREFGLTGDWQQFTVDFIATRSSDNATFRFGFTSTGTLWIEGMRLEELP
jgi:hypothetical protein